MRTIQSILCGLLLLLPVPALAATFAPVHSVGGDVWVELGTDVASLQEGAGPPRRIASADRHAFVRSLAGAPGEDRTVRLFAQDGACDGRIGLVQMLGLYESFDEGATPEDARWMAAAKVRGCHGPFVVAVIDPPDASPVRALEPTDEVAGEAVAAARRLVGASRVLQEARTEWREAFGDDERTREAAWRVRGTTFALADVTLEGGECGSELTVRALVARDESGRVSVVLRPSRLAMGDEVVAIGDLDGDGAADLVARGPDDAVRVMRLEAVPEIVLEGGEVPFHGCSC